jgi:CheY-like chemotaxis protein
MADQDEDSVKLALLAHDLRTPLAAMRLTAELIGTGPLNDTQSDQLSILIQSIDALTQMTTDLVVEARPGPGAEGAPVRVADIVRDVTGLFQVAAQAKRLTLEVAFDDSAADLRTGKPAPLRRVLTTLLDNAVKYTAAGGISVEMNSQPPGRGAEPPMVVLSVTDSGPGIDPEEGARLFRPFVRGRHGRATGPGTGLGLWGAEQLVRDMGGRISLDRSQAGGCRFTVEIPAERDGAEPEGDIAAPERAPGPVSGLLPFHALVVDDNETNCRLLSALLESFGITCDVARSGGEAIELVRKGPYDAALVDLHMPEMDGVETAEKLRELRSCRELPLIAVTAALESVGNDSLRQAGFQEVLAKPLSPAALYQAMEDARQLKRSGAGQARRKGLDRPEGWAKELP